METDTVLKNENGIALITALMLLVLLTLLGMAATTTSVLEIQIADNDRDYKVNFYKAETAAYEAAREMGVFSQGDNPIPLLEGEDIDWILTQKEVSADKDLTDLDNWETAISANEAKASTYNSGTAAYAARFVKIYEQEMTKDYSMRLFRVLGRSKDNKGQALVEIGLKLTYENLN